jgi:UDP-N-acetyl-D-galactosamine dehydrogenase
MLASDDIKIGMIGLGYVGLPLAVAFARHLPVVGFDIDRRRVDALNQGDDRSREVSGEELADARSLQFSATIDALKDCNVYIVTVPTPVDQYKRPNLSAMVNASRAVAGVLSAGDVVVFESTVYPGATEDVCVPVLEHESGLRFNKDFFVGYSPERINPGDKEHRVTDIIKVTSGSTPEAAEFVDQLYRRVIRAGTHKTSSIRVAEAAKVIENTQRDVNIALINELAMLFERLEIDTHEVLTAAGTKWNFLPFRPGLVGGHCIGVDPYYLTHKAREVGHHPEMILAGRRVNDDMGTYVAGRVVKLMARKRIAVAEANILVLGLTFKENCPDIRNTRVIDVIRELEDYHAQVEVHDPWIDVDEARAEYGVNIVNQPADGRYDAIILAVAHQQFVEMGVEKIKALGKTPSVIFDVKNLLPRDQIDGRL